MSMSNEYSTQHVAALYDVAIETVRTWAQEFERHLSPTANPGRRRQRMFTAEDMAVFDLVAALKSKGRTFQDIHAALDAGQRGGSPETPPAELQDMIVNDDRRQLVALNDELKRRIEKLYLEIEQLKDLERASIRMQAQLENEIQRAERAESRVFDLLQEQAALREQIGELKGELKYLLRAMGHAE